ncbi:hypothetical protein ACN2MM_03325 [Alkalilimnicola ehrlichii MLHE-1]|uniref:Lipoprotein n=1 Tax=Alkalilimnicola ehrlichii (strain ATCC BAA-1101 / DSM 17681 / MLHE-1) TaxID=187272 RepID=Q0AB88_ALKEH|nr:hypothetical protein [Alkalilimnicola ehrlichii]ABI55899.1 hypothetical protein Mlg_0545 [Alkalilimnicola ehrlichii MLHE-1]
MRYPVYCKGALVVGLLSPLALTGCLSSGSSSGNGDEGTEEMTAAESEEMAVGMGLAPQELLFDFIGNSEEVLDGPPPLAEADDGMGGQTVTATGGSGWDDFECDTGTLEVTSGPDYFELDADECMRSSSGPTFDSDTLIDGYMELDFTVTPDAGYDTALHWTANDYRSEVETTGDIEMHFWMTFDGEYENHFSGAGVEDARLEVLSAVNSEFGGMCDGQEVRMSTQMDAGLEATIEGPSSGPIDFTIDGGMSVGLYSEASDPTIDRLFSVVYDTVADLRLDDPGDDYPSSGELHMEGSAGGHDFNITMTFHDNEVCIDGATEIENRCYSHAELDDKADDEDDFNDDFLCAVGM